MATHSLLGLVTARSVRILLECFLVSWVDGLLPSTTKLQRLCFYTCVSVQRGGLSQCMLRYPPGSRQPPPARAGTPPRKEASPRSRHLPPADGYCCGQYVSYWNAFFLNNFISSVQTHSTWIHVQTGLSLKIFIWNSKSKVHNCWNLSVSQCVE